jgi:hypothetical protein
VVEPIPTRRAKLLLVRDDDVRWLEGKVWKVFLTESAEELSMLLACHDPYERHFDEASRSVHVLMYSDLSHSEFAHFEWPCLPAENRQVWVGYSFKKRNQLNAMRSDIASHTSVWKEEAVPTHVVTLRMPVSALKSKQGRVVVIREAEVPVTMFV